jgi:hypothetical protein
LGIPIVSLVADVNRGAGPQSLMVPTGVGTIRLQAEVPDVASDLQYSIVIDDAAGTRLFDGASLTVHSAGPYHFVDALVPAAALAPGERTVSLRESRAGEGAPPKFTWHVAGIVDSRLPN